MLEKLVERKADEYVFLCEYSEEEFLAMILGEIHVRFV